MAVDARKPTRRPSTAALAVAAFVLAGAASGGAISAAALSAADEPPIIPSAEDIPPSVGDPQLDALIWVAISLANVGATQTGGELLGSPYTLTGDGAAETTVTRVDGANRLAFSIACAAPGTFAVAVDSFEIATLECTDDPDDATAIGDWIELGEGEHSVAVTGNAPFALWASWLSTTPGAN